MPTSIKTLLAVMLAALFYVFFIMFSPEEATKKSLESMDKKRMAGLIEDAMGMVSQWGRVPGSTINAEPMAKWVAGAMNEGQAPSPDEQREAPALGKSQNAPISFFVHKVTGPWQVAVIPLENPCRIQYEGFGYDPTNPIVVEVQDCVLVAP